MREQKTEKRTEKKRRNVWSRAVAVLLVVALLISDNISALQVSAAEPEITQSIEDGGARGQENKEPSGQSSEGEAQVPGEDTQIPGAGSQTPDAGSQTPGAGSQASGADTQIPGAGSQTSGPDTQISGTGSQTPDANTQKLEAPEEEKEADVRVAIDWTQDKKALALTAEQAAYTVTNDAGKSEEKVAEASKNRIDLTGADADSLVNMKLSFGFEFIREMDKRELQAGDTFTYTLPSEYFTLKDTAQPVKLQNADKEKYREDGTLVSGDAVLGTYTTASNIIKVTLATDVDFAKLEQIFGVITVPVTLNVEKLSTKEDTSVKVTLQPDSDAEIVLPRAGQESDDKNSEAKDDSTQNDETAEDVKAEDAKTEDAKNEDVKKNETKQDGTADVLSAYTPWGVSMPPLFKSGGSIIYNEADLPVDGKTNPVISAQEDSMVVGDETYYPFKSISMQLPQKSEGFQNGDEYSFSFTAQLNDDYLENWRESIANSDAYREWEATSEEAGQEEDPLTYYILHVIGDNLEPVSFQLNMGKDFSIPNEAAAGTLNNSSGTRIGDYTVTKDADGNAVLKVSFIKDVYAGYRIFGQAGVTLNFNKEDAAADDKFDVDWDDNTDAIVVAEHVGESDPIYGGAGYAIIKNAPENVESPDIAYTIEVKADGSKGKSLDGMVLRDVVPAGLEVRGFAVNGNSLGSDAYTVSNGILEYTFPEGTGTEAVVVVSTSLTLELYKEFLTSGAKWDKQFQNTASLHTPGTDEELCVSDNIKTDMSMTFFEKDGKQNSADRSKIDWTIKVDTSGSSLVEAYLIDKIDGTTLSYDLNSGIQMRKEDGTSTVIKNITSLTDITTPYSELTIDTVKAIMKSAGGAGGVTYSVGGETILIIPYGEAYQGQKIEVGYSTQIKAPDVGNSSVEKFSNEATMVWEKWTYGDGPEQGSDWFKFNITKDTDIDYKLITKSAGNYDEESQLMEWNLKTNSFAVDVNNVVITDNIPAGQKLQTDMLTYTKQGKPTQQTLPVYNADGPVYPSYTVASNDKGGETLTIYCGDLGNADYYNFKVYTKVTDTAILSLQGEASLHNDASITGKIGDATLTNDSNIDAPIHNTWVEKEVTEGYNATNHTIKWKVTVNPNHIGITKGVITDILPQDENGSTIAAFTSLDKIEKTAQAGGEPQELSDKGSAVFDLDASGDPKQFTLTYRNAEAADTATYDVYFTTTVTDAWRASNHESTDFINHVHLSGVTGQDSIYEMVNDMRVEYAAASAGAPVKNIELAKQNINLKDGRIKWTIVMNTGAIDMTGYVLNEDFRELNNVDGGPFLELDTDLSHFELYKIKLSEDGSWKLGDAVTDESWKDALTDVDEDNGFNFTIPSAYASTPIAIVFYSYGLTNTPGGTIKNKVTLNKGNGGEAGNDITADSTVDQEFDMDSYGDMIGIPALKLKKVSSNTAVNCSILLSGAVYTIESYEKNANGVYEFKKTKNRTSGSNGTLIFTNLKNDVIYKVFETTAPSGYTVKNDAYYYMFSADLADTEGNYSLKKDGADTQIKKSSVTVYNVNKKRDAVVVDDVPKGNVQFTKYGNDGTTPLEKASFKLVRDDGKWDEHITKTAESGSDGVVTFGELDPGTYTLTETAAPDEYKVLTGSVTVTVSETGEAAYTNKSGSSMKIKENNGTYYVRNEYVKGTLKIQKTDIEKGNNAAVSGGKFGLYVADTYGTANEEKVGNSTEAKNGQIVFDKLLTYGKAYEVIEEEAPKGYILPAEKKIAAITAGTYTDSQQFSLKKNKSFEITLKDTVTNTRSIGTIQFTKNRYENDALTGFAGRTFFLICTDNDLNAEQVKANSYFAGADNGWEFKSSIAENGYTYRNCYVKEISAGTKGLVQFTEVPFGRYQILEKESGLSDDDPYEVSEAAWEISVLDNKNAGGFTQQGSTYVWDPISPYTNELLKASLTITKTVKDENGKGSYFDGDKLAGVTFALSGKDIDGNSVSRSGKTNASGIVIIDDIPVSGTEGYILTETHDLSGYYPAAETNTYMVKVTASGHQASIRTFEKINARDKTGTLTWSGNSSLAAVTNQPYIGTMEFVKKCTSSISAHDNQNLAGAAFALYAVNDTQNEVLIQENVMSLDDGSISFSDVVYGQEYRLYEMSAPDGYNLPSGEYIEGKGVLVKTVTGNEITSFDDLTHTFAYNNDEAIENATSQINISKVDALTSSAIGGAVFTLQRVDGSSKTDVYFQQDGTANRFEESVSGAAGAVKEITTDAGGRISFVKLLQGTYELTEIKPGSGYALTGKETAVFTVDEFGRITNENLQENVTKTGTTGLLFKNKENSLAFTKVFTDKDGNGISFAGNLPAFGLFLNGTAVKTETVELTADKKAATITFEQIPANEENENYTLQEVTSDSGYAIDNTVYTVHVDKTSGKISVLDAEGKEVTQAAGNLVLPDEKPLYQNKQNGITIHKMYLDAGQAKPDSDHSVFTLVDAANETNVIAASAPVYDQNNEYDVIAFAGVSNGTYQLRETPASGYQAYAAGTDEDPWIQITVVNGRITSVTRNGEAVTQETSSTDIQTVFGISNTPVVTDIAVDKVWDMVSAGDVKLDNISYTLVGSVMKDGSETAVTPRHSDGTAVKPEAADVNDSYKAVFRDVAAYEDGQLIDFSIVETTQDASGTGNVCELGYEVIVTKITDVSSAVTTGLTVTNTENKLTIPKIFKSGSETAVRPGTTVTFGLYKEGQQTAAYTAEVQNIAEKNDVMLGTAVFEKIADGTYILRETAAETFIPMTVTYVVKVEKGRITVYNSTGETKLSMAGNGMVRVEMEGINNYAMASFSFQKTCEIQENEKGLDGAEFKLTPADGQTGVSPEKTAVSQTADNKKGMVTFRNILPGNYTLTETQTAAGYLISDAQVNVAVDEQGNITFMNGESDITGSYAERLSGLYHNVQSSITVRKLDDSDTQSAVSGVTLRITPNPGSKLNITTGDNAYYEWKTNGLSDGISLSNVLVGGGTYTISEPESGRVDGYLTASPITFTYTKDGKVSNVQGANENETDITANSYSSEDDTITFVMRDQIIHGSVKLIKKLPAGYTDYEGLTFELYQHKGSAEETDLDKYDKIQSGITLDAKGTAAADGLAEGSYFFRETATKDTLYLDRTASDVVYIGPDQDEQTVTINMENVNLETYVTLTKTDAGDENSTVGKAGDILAGAEFTLYETTAGSDGEDKQLDKKETDADGMVTFTINKSGTYRVTETKPPYGYELGDSPYSTTFVIENTVKDQLQTKNLGMITNARTPGTVSLTKKDKETGLALAETEFTLYTKAGEAVQALKTDNNGKLTFTDISWGEYYVQESEAVSGYVPDAKKYPVNIGNAQDMVLTKDLGVIENTQTEVSFNKVILNQETSKRANLNEKEVDSSGCVPLTGAVFGLYEDEACTEPVKNKEGEAVTAASDASGIVTFRGVKVGKTYIKEINSGAPKALLNSEVFRVEIDKTGKFGGLQTLSGQKNNNVLKGNTVVNDVVRGNIGIRKVDENNPDKVLPGSVYGLYRANNIPLSAILGEQSRSRAKSFSDASGEEILVATSKTDEKGMLVFDNVLTGVRYTIRELQAPDGSMVSKKPISLEFVMDKNGKAAINADTLDLGEGTASIDADGNITWLEPSTKITILKKDTDGKLLAGASLRITDEEGKAVEGVKDWVSSVSEGHLIEGVLTAGKTYILTELSAPDGYEVAEPVKFTVDNRKVGPNENYIQTVEMIDKKAAKKQNTSVTSNTGSTGSTAAKTGDNTPVLPWGLSMTAALAVIYGLWRRKKVR